MAARSTPATDRTRASRPSDLPSRRHVLVVDDDSMQLKLDAVRLSQAGLLVHTASGALEALELARIVMPDVILSDVVMGEIDGFNFCRMVRQDPKLMRVPVVLASAHFSTSCDRELAAAVGANELVERTPGFGSELKAVLRSLDDQRCRAGVSSSSPALPELYARSVAGRLTRFANDSRSMELKYRALLQNATDAIAILDHAGVVLDINPRWEQILVRTRTEIVGHHIDEFAAPGYQAGNEAHYREALVGRSTGPQNVVLLRSDQRIAYIEISHIPLEADGLDVVLTIGRDVTETVEDKRRLEESERKYRSLIENMPDVVWSATPKFELTFISPSCMKATGYSATEMLDRQRALSLVHGEDLARVRHAFEVLSSDKTPIDIEYRSRHRDGSWRWLQTRAAPVLDEHGHIERIDGSFFDVTSRHELEDQMRQAQKMEAVGMLTNGVAHDFNNILAVILANCQFLIEELPAGTQPRLDAEEIERAAQRAAKLTSQLLAFSRQQVMAPIALDMNRVVSGLDEMLRRLISEDIELVTAAAAEDCMVRADPGQLEQVIMNLVVNARDAMPHGGSLRIETSIVDVVSSKSRSGSLVDAPSPSGKYVRLRVADSGIGMDERTRRKIFDPFFTTKAPGKGTGLGLSTCHGIVKQSDGFIEVGSELTVGTTFDVYLPCVDSAPEIAAPPAVSTHTAKGETLLLIEDDEVLRNAIVRTLRANGYGVFAACNGSEALMLAREHADSIRLVLSDMVVSDLNGLEIIERVKQVVPDARAMLMSGHVDHAALQHREQWASTPFLQKPFSSNAFLARLRQVLDA